jgi:hypothetical protein
VVPLHTSVEEHDRSLCIWTLGAGEVRLKVVGPSPKCHLDLALEKMLWGLQLLSKEATAVVHGLVGIALVICSATAMMAGCLWSFGRVYMSDCTAVYIIMTNEDRTSRVGRLKYRAK